MKCPKDAAADSAHTIPSSKKARTKKKDGKTMSNLGWILIIYYTYYACTSFQELFYVPILKFCNSCCAPMTYTTLISGTLN